MAPRPHNSGHHTIEACFTSQFEQHLRAVAGLPLGDPSMKTPAAIMYNILGENEVSISISSLLSPIWLLDCLHHLLSRGCPSKNDKFEEKLGKVVMMRMVIILISYRERWALI